MKIYILTVWFVATTKRSPQYRYDTDQRQTLQRYHVVPYSNICRLTQSGICDICHFTSNDNGFWPLWGNNYRESARNNLKKYGMSLCLLPGIWDEVTHAPQYKPHVPGRTLACQSYLCTSLFKSKNAVDKPIPARYINNMRMRIGKYLFCYQFNRCFTLLPDEQKI